MTAAVAALTIGTFLGDLGQRSRICFPGGIRDVRSSVAYLAGFFAGAVMFHAAIAPLLLRLLP